MAYQLPELNAVLSDVSHGKQHWQFQAPIHDTSDNDLRLRVIQQKESRRVSFLRWVKHPETFGCLYDQTTHCRFHNNQSHQVIILQKKSSIFIMTVYPIHHTGQSRWCYASLLSDAS